VNTPLPVELGAGRRHPAGNDLARLGRVARNARVYLAVTDPKSVSLLLFTTVAAGIVAGGLRAPAHLVQVALALGLSCMGARAVANYADRDIDRLMARTRRRPVPSGAIPAVHALYLGIALILAGLAVAVPFGPLVVLLIAAGLADNLLVYSRLTKRTTPLSIVLGAPSGGTPALVGYVAIAGGIDLTAILLAALVMVWTPIHIWSLAIRYREDYARANVPMLPVVIGVTRSARYVGYASIGLGSWSLLYLLAASSRIAAPVSVGIIGLAVALIVASLWLVRKPTGEHAWQLFKLTSPYLALVYALLAVNALMLAS